VTWLDAFDLDQLAEMAAELIEAYRNDGLEAFDAVLHEWVESGWAALSAEHDTAFRAQ
jgi:hypothetical protein